MTNSLGDNVSDKLNSLFAMFREDGITAAVCYEFGLGEFALNPDCIYSWPL